MRQVHPAPIHASIIVVNYNTRQTLLRCVGSLLPSLGADCEVIVVDNASADGSLEALETAFPSVTTISAPSNEGFGKGCNLGARHARGKYLVFLNPDTTVAPHWLEALVAPLEADGAAGLVTAKILLADRPDRINTCGNVVHLSGLTLCRGLGHPKHAFDRSEEVHAVSGAACAISRDLFDHLGGFDEEMFLYVEDTDLSLRARLAGRFCWYVPDSVVFHQYLFRLTPSKIFYQERNRYLMLLKTLRWRTLAVLLPAQLLAEVIAWSFVLLRDRAHLKNKLRAYAWVVRNWATVMQKRRATQRLRRVPDRTLLRHMDFRLDFTQVAEGGLAALGRLVVNPLFFVWKTVALAIVWW
jgi:GT2 family glycosyltransferase